MNISTVVLFSGIHAVKGPSIVGGVSDSISGSYSTSPFCGILNCYSVLAKNQRVRSSLENLVLFHGRFVVWKACVDITYEYVEVGIESVPCEELENVVRTVPLNGELAFWHFLDAFQEACKERVRKRISYILTVENLARFHDGVGERVRQFRIAFVTRVLAREYYTAVPVQRELDIRRRAVLLESS